MTTPTADHVRIDKVETLSDNWYTLRKYTFDLHRRDGSWQRQAREAYDRGNGVTILLYHRGRGTVVLTRQFRLPAFTNGLTDGMLIETPAGLLDARDPAEAIHREVEEETGYHIDTPVPLFDLFMSPGSVTERVMFFTARIDDDDRRSSGGGEHGEGEDIEVLEVTLDQALAMIEDGRIRDAKTIILLYHAHIHGLLKRTG